MKTCILISGEPRVYNHTYFTIKPFIEYINADVFIHAWNDETTPRCNNIVERSKTLGHDQEKLKTNLQKCYNPKKIQIQSKNKLKDFLYKENIPHIPQDYDKYMNSNYGSVGQWYSAQECNRLKQEYEKENNFKYDIQIKTRFDTILTVWEDSQYNKINRIMQNTTTGITDIYTPWFHLIDGQIFIEYSTLIGNNTAMDKVWFNIVQDVSWSNIFGHCNPHVSITEHIRKNKIMLKHWEDLNLLLRIIRPTPSTSLLKEYWDKKDISKILQIVHEGNTQWKV
tara:strand:+ start:93 stop:938 length:846 start_codon:yes stop_codon:yes gene_type:complete